VAIGAFSGTLYQSVSAYCVASGRPEAVWYILAAHLVLGALLLHVYVRSVGEFQEQAA
jgi:hypothetical protein